MRQQQLLEKEEENKSEDKEKEDNGLEKTLELDGTNQASIEKQEADQEQARIEEINVEEDTALETKSAVWDERVNLELTEHTLRKTEKKVIEDGEEQKIIEIDEEDETRNISYPTPESVYRKETDKAEPQQEVQAPQILLVKLKSLPQSQEKEVVEVKASREELKPTVEAVEVEESSIIQPEDSERDIPEQENFSFEPEQDSTSRFEQEEDNVPESNYRQEEETYVESESEEYRVPESPIEEISKPDLELDEKENNYGALEILEFEAGEEEESAREEFLDLLEDSDDVESYEVDGTVLQTEHSEDSEIDNRTIVDLESMFSYRESVRGSEVVETMWQDYGIEATVAEVPYFSENSGPSWDEGWNSFDMILQMGEMNIQDMEYLNGDLYELNDLEQPAMKSIGSEFDTSEAIEFRESEEFSNHDGGYSASEETKNAWAERYGDEVLDLDPMERGIYAAFEEGNDFRGAPLKPEEIDFMSDSAVEML